MSLGKSPLLQRLKTVWPAIVREVRVYDKTLTALLNSGVRPVDIKEDRVWLEAPTDWLLKRLELPYLRQIIERVLSKHLKANYSVEFILDSQDLDKTYELRSKIRIVRKDPFIKAAINVFDADIVGIIENINISNGSAEKSPNTPIIKEYDIDQEPERTPLDQFTAVDLAKDLLDAQGAHAVAKELSVLLERIRKMLPEIPEEEIEPLNATIIGDTPIIYHDRLRFRSRAEIAIYNALKKRDVLFFPNSAAVLGGKNTKREPDFLICREGKWGLLEVMGKYTHTAETAVKDHDRARLFDDYGLNCIHFYSAEQCFNNPSEVVDDFLTRLNRS